MVPDDDPAEGLDEADLLAVLEAGAHAVQPQAHAPAAHVPLTADLDLGTGLGLLGIGFGLPLGFRGFLRFGGVFA